jgi:hypothetical protein
MVIPAGFERHFELSALELLPYSQSYRQALLHGNQEREFTCFLVHFEPSC